MIGIKSVILWFRKVDLASESETKRFYWIILILDRTVGRRLNQTKTVAKFKFICDFALCPLGSTSTTK
jgi:hypothetical protein